MLDNYKPAKLNDPFPYNNSMVAEKKSVSSKFNDCFVDVGNTSAGEIHKSRFHFDLDHQRLTENQYFLRPLTNNEFVMLSEIYEKVSLDATKYFQPCNWNHP